jgi:serine/threonine protein kinase
LYIFTEQINGRQDWERLFQSVPAFTALVEHILAKENLPTLAIENLTPGTNAVFKSGDYVVKIFAPDKAGITGVGTDFEIEVYGIKRANALGIPTPKCIAIGVVKDRYTFQYIVTEYLNATAFQNVEHRLSYEEKIIFGQKLRVITDKLNTPCDNFNPVDIIENAKNNARWQGYSDSFNDEREACLSSIHIDENDKVYCHGDLNPDNIFVDENMILYIMDFADAMYAPAGYEQALITCELFCFEKPYMTGYFGDYSVEVITDLCAKWLPLHDSGEHTLRCNIGPASEIVSFSVMRERLYNMIE